MADNRSKKWDLRYLKLAEEGGVAASKVVAADVLIQNRHLLPANGSALDLACGLGGNAMFLASCGLEASAWDNSAVAISQLTERVRTEAIELNAECRDVIEKPPQKTSFDIIVVSRFLHRETSASLVDALKPGGLLFYQTFVSQTIESGMAGHVQTGRPGNPDYLLQPNELLSLFIYPYDDMTVRHFQDYADCGDQSVGLRNESMLVAQKLSQRRQNIESTVSDSTDV